MKIIKPLLTLLAILLVSNIYAQVAINTSGASPDNSAILDLTNTAHKGLLIPVVTDTSLVPSLTASSKGLMIFLDKTPNKGYYYYNGTYWQQLITSTSATSQVNSDWNAITGIAQILNKPSLATVATTGAYSDLTGIPSLASVATSGAYSDLTGKPTLGSMAALNNPMTTLGDIIYGGASGFLTRLAAGSDGNILTLASGVPTWQAAASGMVYPGIGVPNSTGSAWGTSYTVGIGNNNLVQLNASGQLPAVSAALLTNFPTFNQSTTGTAANITGTIAIANGGTGQTTASGAINALLPNQAASAGSLLSTNGTSTFWNSNPLPINYGGTGLSDGTNLIPSVSGNSGKFLYTNGSTAFWQSASPAGVSSVAVESPLTNLGNASDLDISLGTILVGNGGTGINSYLTGDILYASNSASLAVLHSSTAGKVLLSGSSAPAWGKVALSGATTHITGTLPVANGGTGAGTFSAGFIKSPGGTGALTGGNSVNLSTDVSGVLSADFGGTGISDYTSNPNQLLYTDGTSLLPSGTGLTWDGSTFGINSSQTMGVTTISGVTTLDASYNIVLCTAGSSYTITLPAAVSGNKGRIYTIKIISGGNNLTIQPASGNIESSSSFSLNASGKQSVEVVCDGSAWWVIAKY